MLEDDQNAHVKAYQKVQTWDNAHRSTKELFALKQKSLDLFRELGRSIAYERALAHVGIDKKDVSSPIYGAQIGSIDNYKRTKPIKACTDHRCPVYLKPQSGEDCRGGCGNPLVVKNVPISLSDLRTKLANHMLGVELNDGRRVWFKEPVAPNIGSADFVTNEASPDAPEADAEARKKTASEQRRFGKWW